MMIFEPKEIDAADRKLFLFIVSVFYHLCFPKGEISSRYVARSILMFFKVKKEFEPGKYLDVETLAHYIRREPDFEKCLEEIHRRLKEKFRSS